jgi:hypothetical protein
VTLETRQARTRRWVRRVDRAIEGFSAVVTGAAQAIAALIVRGILALERLQRATDETLPGDRFIDGRWQFVCPWCGSRTPEHEILPLTCCRLESWELRRHLLESHARSHR